MRRSRPKKSRSVGKFKARASRTNGVNIQSPPRGGFRL